MRTVLDLLWVRVGANKALSPRVDNWKSESVRLSNPLIRRAFYNGESKPFLPDPPHSEAQNPR